MTHFVIGVVHSTCITYSSGKRERRERKRQQRALLGTQCLLRVPEGELELTGHAWLRDLTWKVCHTSMEIAARSWCKHVNMRSSPVHTWNWRQKIRMWWILKTNGDWKLQVFRLCILEGRGGKRTTAERETGLHEYALCVFRSFASF